MVGGGGSGLWMNPQPYQVLMGNDNIDGEYFGSATPGKKVLKKLSPTLRKNWA